MCGISEESLRIWERRYAWPRPRRTAGGARLYTASDIERLVWVRRAMEHGFRPGAVVEKSASELERLVARSGPARAAAADDTPTVAGVFEAVKAGDARAVQDVLRRAAMLLGGRRFVVEFAQPACVEIGDRWATGGLSVHHEHLFSAALSAQLKIVTMGFDVPRGAFTVLLTTLPGARHGLGIELVAAYLASRGVAPVLLGVETPADQILLAARAHRPRAIGVGITPPVDLPAATAALVEVAQGLRRGGRTRPVDVWIGGAAAHELRVRDSAHTKAIRLVDDWAKLDDAVEQLRG